VTAGPPPFAYRALPMRVRFGAGSVREIAQETGELGLTRILALSSPGHREVAEAIAAVRAVATYVSRILAD